MTNGSEGAPVKAIILDIGNVICEWNPHKLVAMAYPGPGEPLPQELQQVMDATIVQDDWAALDRGTLEQGVAIARACERSYMDPAWIEAVYHCTPASLEPLPETIAAMHKAHEAGMPLYVLSNMQKHAGKYLLEQHDFFQLFTHVILSCDINLLKPEPAIYQHLIEVCNLDAAASVFLDDMAVNVEGAIASGLQSIQMTDIHSGGKLIDELLRRAAF